jgi:LacI family transcriptional regulator
MVGIKDVALHAGVSVGTVSNALNRPHLVSPETRHLVESAIASLGYIRSESARQLRAGHSRVMALLVLDSRNPFFLDIAAGAEQVAREHGLMVMLCSSGQNQGEEEAYLAHFAQQKVLGVLLSPLDGNQVDTSMLRRGGVPAVLVDRGAGLDESCSVSVDDVLGGELATGHLLERGHRSIAFVGGPTALRQVENRVTGARNAVESAGLDPGTLSVLETRRLDIPAGQDAAQRLLGLASRPTAVFCANDLLALGVLQALFGMGVRVPDDIAIVGYDDIEFAGAAAVPITSVRQPAFQIGRTSAEMLLAEAGEDPGAHQHQRVVYQPELIVRASTMGGASASNRL